MLRNNGMHKGQLRVRPPSSTATTPELTILSARMITFAPIGVMPRSTYRIDAIRHFVGLFKEGVEPCVVHCLIP